MNEVEKFYTWEFDAVSIVTRYFLLAGVAYFIFYIVWRESFSKKRIQREFPPRHVIKIEIFYSAITLAIYCATSGLVFYWQKLNITKIYLDVRQYGYPYFFLSIIIMVIIHDAYFYWTHRLLHLPIVFKLVHKTHHHSFNPNPWSSFSFHPLEALVSIGIIPIIIFFIPCHPLALFAFLTYMTLMSVMGHLGYETFPKTFIKSRIGKWQNTSTNHNIHHQLSHHNYGLYFTWWDRLMGTYRDGDE